MDNLYFEQANAAIDKAHADLIYGLIVSLKPKHVLELGFGTGATTKAILQALEYNQIKSYFTLVDNWLDFDGKLPIEQLSNIMPDLTLETRHIISYTEEDFINIATENNQSFDFIMSDADHTNSHQWFHKTLDLVNDGGIACFHDVTSQDFPNLYSNIEFLELHKDIAPYHWKVFNLSSRNNEKCNRGLLVVFKD